MRRERDRCVLRLQLYPLNASPVVMAIIIVVVAISRTLCGSVVWEISHYDTSERRCIILQGRNDILLDYAIFDIKSSYVSIFIVLRVRELEFLFLASSSESETIPPRNSLGILDLLRLSVWLILAHISSPSRFGCFDFCHSISAQTIP